MAQLLLEAPLSKRKRMTTTKRKKIARNTSSSYRSSVSRAFLMPEVRLTVEIRASRT